MASCHIKKSSPIKNAQLRRRLGAFERSCELTLRVLRTLTRFTQTNFLTFNFTGVASYEASFAQCTYMEEFEPFNYREDLAAPTRVVLKQLLAS